MDEKELSRLGQMSVYEQDLAGRGYRLIAGVDEAGRGPLAGPVAAAAVILPPGCLIEKLNDSKKLSPARRLALEPIIREKAIACAVATVDNLIIDEINILEASRLAMVKAVEMLRPAPDYLLLDAMTLPLDIEQTGLIHGDALSVSIAAASILAKNHRDRLMVELDALYPQYGFAKHKGYPTAAHRQAIKQYGLSPVHRRTFRVK
ncbi:MAG: ribonuclease HII [Firmicutes bacterium]|nr:ribonuclease HII [Bacillota bacterium]